MSLFRSKKELDPIDANVCTILESPKQMNTMKHIGADRDFALTNTLGGAWLIPYFWPYVCDGIKQEKENDEEFEMMIEGKTKEEAEYFINSISKCAEKKKILFIFEHPFHDRVLFEHINKDNLRYAAEMLICQWVISDVIKQRKINAEVIWHREPLPLVGQALYIDPEDCKKGFKSIQLSDYCAFGRTNDTNKVINIPGDKEESDFEIRYKNWKEILSPNNTVAKEILGIKENNIGLCLPVKRRRSTHVHIVEQIRRQITINKMLSSDSVPALKDILSLNWLPLDGMHDDCFPIKKYDKILFEEPLSWRGSGLLLMLAHETDVAVTLFDFLLKQKLESEGKNLKEELFRKAKLSYVEVRKYLENGYVTKEVPRMIKIIEYIEKLARDSKDKEVESMAKETNRKINQNLGTLKNQLRGEA